MAASLQSAKTTVVPFDLGKTIPAITSKIVAAIWSFVKAVQTGQMISALSRMSDEQLAQIGISCSEIASHAAKLLDD